MGQAQPLRGKVDLFVLGAHRDDDVYRATVAFTFGPSSATSWA